MQVERKDLYLFIKIFLLKIDSRKIFYMLIHVNGLLDYILLETKGRFEWKQGESNRD